MQIYRLILPVWISKSVVRYRVGPKNIRGVDSPDAFLPAYKSQTLIPENQQSNPVHLDSLHLSACFYHKSQKLHHQKPEFQRLVIPQPDRQRNPCFHKRRPCINCPRLSIFIMLFRQKPFQINQMDMRVWLIA